MIEPSGKARADSPGDDEKLTVPEDIAAQEEEESYGFAHPAASRPQRIVWIPQDTLGLTKEEEGACNEAGVRVSHVHAQIDETGKVSIDGGPPDLI